MAVLIAMRVVFEKKKRLVLALMTVGDSDKTRLSFMEMQCMRKKIQGGEVGRKVEGEELEA